MNSLKQLTTNQKKAIEYGKGPLLIIAGAGTGKTTVITERISHLILEKKVNPSHILALTFTDKASHEMQERVDIALPYGYTNLWIHTFHSFCDRILRDEAHSIGLDPNYKLLSESESILFLGKNIFELGLKLFKPLGNPTKFLDSLLVHFSRLKDEDVTPEEYMAWAMKQESRITNQELRGVMRAGDPHRVPASERSEQRTSDGGGERQDPESIEQYIELANAYKNYENLKIKESLMDFSDLIANTLLLLRTRKHIAKRYQDMFEYILVDEFQDTNYAQNELAILLAGTDKNITVVADDDQSIYRFRGAAVSNVLQFKKSFPDAAIVTLTDNYRSTQTILDASHCLIQYNNPNRLEVVEKIDKKLISHSSSKEKAISLIHTMKAEDEADEIAKTIRKLAQEGTQYSDIAILVRANNHSQLLTAALSRHRIPYQFLGPGYLFQQEEIKDLIAYLTFLTNLSDSVALFRVLSMEVLAISYIQLNYLLTFAKKKNVTLFEAVFEGDVSFLQTSTREKLKAFKTMVTKHIERIKKDTPGQILYYFLVDSGLYASLEKADTVEGEKRVQNIAKFFDRIKNFESERPNTTIFTLVEWLTLMMQLGDSPLAAEIDMKDRNAVNILTVHSSKGLEFKVVFLVNLVSDRFPTRERSEKIPLPEGIVKEKLRENTDFHLEEERRLFYVGMTRAKDELYFTAANYYGSGKRIKKLSPFIFEAVPTLRDEIKSPTVKQLSLGDISASFVKEIKETDEKPQYKVDYITFSNLQMFNICPLHYKAKVLFHIPTPKVGVQSFGISIHNALYTFYRQVIDGHIPTFVDLQNTLKKVWDSEGYINKKDEELRFAQANNILENFYQKECNPPTKPLGLELPFSFTLKNRVKVFGKIDRIDKNGQGLLALPDRQAGVRQGIEIIDYKTGENNPKAKETHKLQLAIYALAASRVKDDVLNRDPKDIILTLYFLEDGTKESMTFSKEDLDRFENELILKIEEIEKSNFACSRHILCTSGRCEYSMLCQF